MWRSNLRRSFSTVFFRPSILPPPSPTAALFVTSHSTDDDDNNSKPAAAYGAVRPRFSPENDDINFAMTSPISPAVLYGGVEETVRRRSIHSPSSSAAMRWLSTATYGGVENSALRRSILSPSSSAAMRRPYAAARWMTTAAGGGGKEEGMSLGEVKKLMRLVNIESLKTKLIEEGKEVISYEELLKACESSGVVRSVREAEELAKVLDEAGVVLLFRDKVYLHPDKVVELVTSSVPLALTPVDDPRREELKRLQERKEEIDRQAHRQVRIILWSGLGVAIMQVGLFFRLTFWEFSWDVMEPIAFFTTASGLVIGYGYFMITSKDPTYQDLMKTLFLSRQRKLFKKYNFDFNRFKELRDKCKCPFDKKHSDDNLILEDA